MDPSIGTGPALANEEPDGRDEATTDQDIGTVGRWERVRRWRPRTDLAVGTVVGMVIFAVLLFRYRWLFDGPFHLGGDESNQFGIALDSVILRELRGGGSRTGFHHPGPGYFYVWGLADAVRKVFNIPLWRDNAEMIGGDVFVAAQLGALVALVRSHLGSVLQGATVLVAVAVLALDPGLVGGPWLPHMYFITFALFITAGASVAAGRLSTLPIYALTVAFLFHGHIAFTSFVSVGTLLVVVALWRSGGLRRLWRDERRYLWWTGGILGLFALPIVVYTLRDWPGELGKYLEYLRKKGTGGHTLGEAVRYAMQFWPGSSTISRTALMVVSVGALLAIARWKRSRFGLAIAVGVLAMEACLVQYAMRGVDDLAFRYAGIWAYALVGLTVGTAVALVLPDRLTHPTDAVGWLGIGVLSVAAIFLLQRSTSLTYVPLEMDTAPAAVDRMERAAGDRPMVIDAGVNDLGAYLLVPAVLSDAEDRGLEVCFFNREWEVKYGEWRTCTSAERRDGVRFTFRGAETPLPADLAALNPARYQSAYMFTGPVPSG